MLCLTDGASVPVNYILSRRHKEHGVSFLWIYGFQVDWEQKHGVLHKYKESKAAYDDYGAVLSVTEDPDGDESGQPVTTSYSYENKQMGAGAVFHRLTSYTVSGKTIGVSYGASASASDILGRIEKYTWERYTGKEYYCAEEFIGASRWMKSEFHRYYDNAQPNMQHSLTQQVASVNNFGAPEEFQCVQEYDPRDNEPEPLTISREYSYSTASSGAKLQRLTGIDDDITEEQYVSGPDKKFYRSLGYDEFGQVNEATLDEDPTPQEEYEKHRTWTYDAAGNWVNYSYLISGQTTEEEREYNRRNEIDTIKKVGDPVIHDEAVVYDDTSSIIEHDYTDHGVENKSFAYDAWGRMCGYGTTGQSLTVHYGRDAMGRVISRNLTTYYYGNERGPLMRGGSIPQIYVRSRESNRLIALWEIEAAGGQYIFWYIADAAGEIAGTCSFEESGSDSAYTLYYYSPTGEFDALESNNSTLSCDNELYGGVLYGGEALWEVGTKTSVSVDNGGVVHHEIDDNVDNVFYPCLPWIDNGEDRNNEYFESLDILYDINNRVVKLNIIGNHNTIIDKREERELALEIGTTLRLPQLQQKFAEKGLNKITKGLSGKALKIIREALKRAGQSDDPTTILSRDVNMWEKKIKDIDNKIQQLINEIKKDIPETERLIHQYWDRRSLTYAHYYSAFFARGCFVLCHQNFIAKYPGFNTPRGNKIVGGSAAKMRIDRYDNSWNKVQKDQSDLQKRIGGINGMMNALLDLIPRYK